MDDIPQGWAICNGNNGTPNLAGRFILAAGILESGIAIATHSSGGQWTAELTVAQLPPHSFQGTTSRDSHSHHFDRVPKGSMAFSNYIFPHPVLGLLDLSVVPPLLHVGRPLLYAPAELGGRVCSNW